MGRNDYTYSTFDNNIYGFKRVIEVKPIKVRCTCCGYTVHFIYHKPLLCPVCHNYVKPPPRKRDFKERLEKAINEKEN